MHQTQFSRVAGRLAPQLLRAHVERRRERLNGITLRLGTALKTYRDTHHARIERQRERLTTFSERATRAMRILIASRAARTERAMQLLSAFSYREVLKRGYALVRDKAGRPLRAATAIKSGMHLDIEFADGRVTATAENQVTPRKTAAANLRYRGGSGGKGRGGQGNLF